MEPNQTQPVESPVQAAQPEMSPEVTPPQPVEWPAIPTPMAPSMPTPMTTSSTTPIGVASGASLNGDFPPELAGWNWGAFLLNWTWSIGNNTWIGLLMFLPFANVIMPFVLGAKGNEWAWKNRKFESVEQFKAVQRAWAIAGTILFVIGIGLFILGMVLAFSNSSSSVQLNSQYK